MLSPVALTQAFLDRIAAIDSRLSSYILVTGEAALTAARAAEAEIAAGRRLGPLHGIPLALKDIYSTAGIRTTCQSPLLADNVPEADAESVARLKAAGAVILGKLTTHEFANGGPSFDLPWPPARNPWNPDHQPGGSSSGSGVAVAAGLCMGAMGSDTGGSIRSPAGLCGIAGIKPTYGRVSRRGVYPLSWTLDHAGPMAWTVEDCALMLQALAGYDPQDAASVDTPVPDYAAALRAPVRSLRIGFARGWHAEQAMPEMTAALDTAADTLRGLGCTVVEVEPPPLDDFHVAGRLILLSEAYAIHKAHLAARPEAYGQFARDRIRLGAFIPASDYVQALRVRRHLVDGMAAAMADVDLLICANQYGAAESFANSTAPFPFFGKPYLTMPFNVTGQPALTLPCGFSESGLPLGFQIVGRTFDDAGVLQLGHAYQQVRDGLDRRPPI